MADDNDQRKSGGGPAEERLYELDDARLNDPTAPSMGEGSGPLDPEGAGINAGTRATSGGGVLSGTVHSPSTAEPQLRPEDERDHHVETTVMGSAGSPFTRGSLDANPRNNTTGNQQWDMDAAVESSMSDPLEKPSFLDRKDPALVEDPDQNQG